MKLTELQVEKIKEHMLHEDDALVHKYKAFIRFFLQASQLSKTKTDLGFLILAERLFQVSRFKFGT